MARVYLTSRYIYKVYCRYITLFRWQTSFKSKACVFASAKNSDHHTLAQLQTSLRMNLCEEEVIVANTRALSID